MDQSSHKYGTFDKQVELLAMIKDIDSLFRTNRIEYSLCGGTLLGAVREKGFIPWDDDIDIMVDRKNFNKIIRLFGRQRHIGKYNLKRHLWIERIRREDDTREALLATTIDIFVMDNCPDSIIERKLKVFLIKILQGMMKKEQKYDDKSLILKTCLWVTYILGKPFSDSRKYRWYEKVSQIGNNKKSKYLTGYNDLFKLLSLKYSSKLFDQVCYTRFEDTELPITAEFDSYLKTQYGDYMTPPKEEDRKPIHI